MGVAERRRRRRRRKRRRRGRRGIEYKEVKTYINRRNSPKEAVCAGNKKKYNILNLLVRREGGETKVKTDMVAKVLKS